MLAQIELCTNTAYKPFANADANDLVAFTATSTQKILIGYSNTLHDATVTIADHLLQVNGILNAAGYAGLVTDFHVADHQIPPSSMAVKNEISSLSNHLHLSIQQQIHSLSNSFVQEFGILEGELHYWKNYTNPLTQVMLINDPEQRLDIHISTLITSNLNVQGTIYTNYDVQVLSDSRIKTDLVKIQDPLYKIKQLDGYTYSRIDLDEPIPTKHMGLIAQQVELVFPEIVKQYNGIKSIAYGNMMAAVVEALKSIDDRISQIEQHLKL